MNTELHYKGRAEECKTIGDHTKDPILKELWYQLAICNLRLSESQRLVVYSKVVIEVSKENFKPTEK